MLTVDFTVVGIPCLGLNGGPAFKHSEAFSFQIATDDQQETDRYWNAIVGNGGQETWVRWTPTVTCGFAGGSSAFLEGRRRNDLLAGWRSPSSGSTRQPATGRAVAVEGVEFEHGRQVVLFTTESLDLREANALLLARGFHGVMHWTRSVAWYRFRCWALARPITNNFGP